MVLADLKAVKSPAEIRLLRCAAELTDLAMATVRDTLADGRPHTERELARLADAAMIAAGADRTAYDSMVQAGPRSAYNLARPTDRVLHPGDLVMTDIGGPLSRVRGRRRARLHLRPATAEKRAIVEAAAAAVEAGLAAVRPGMVATELNAVIQEALVESGYERYSGEARGHGTGHGTGMDPEEESPWIGPGNRTRLVAGMVFTLKATITVPNVGGLRTQADRPSRRDRRLSPRHVPDAAPLVAAADRVAASFIGTSDVQRASTRSSRTCRPSSPPWGPRARS